jgi:NAD(P)H-nitrite reductase large subunit
MVEELHVTPLTNTVQLRPTLSYIDKSDEKEKASMKRAQQEEVKEEPKAPVGKAQTVQVIPKVTTGETLAKQLSKRFLIDVCH